MLKSFLFSNKISTFVWEIRKNKVCKGKFVLLEKILSKRKKIVFFLRFTYIRSKRGNKKKIFFFSSSSFDFITHYNYRHTHTHIEFHCNSVVRTGESYSYIHLSRRTITYSSLSLWNETEARNKITKEKISVFVILREIVVLVRATGYCYRSHCVDEAIGKRAKRRRNKIRKERKEKFLFFGWGIQRKRQNKKIK